MNADGEFHSRQPRLIRDPRQRNWNRRKIKKIKKQFARGKRKIAATNRWLSSVHRVKCCHLFYVYLVRVGWPFSGPDTQWKPDMNRENWIYMCAKCECKRGRQQQQRNDDDVYFHRNIYRMNFDRPVLPKMCRRKKKHGIECLVNEIGTVQPSLPLCHRCIWWMWLEDNLVWSKCSSPKYWTHTPNTLTINYATVRTTKCLSERPERLADLFESAWIIK